MEEPTEGVGLLGGGALAAFEGGGVVADGGDDVGGISVGGVHEGAGFFDGGGDLGGGGGVGDVHVVPGSVDGGFAGWVGIVNVEGGFDFVGPDGGGDEGAVAEIGGEDGGGFGAGGGGESLPGDGGDGFVTEFIKGVGGLRAGGEEEDGGG